MFPPVDSSGSMCCGVLYQRRKTGREEEKEESMRFSCVLLSMLALMGMSRRGGKSAEKSRAEREKRGVGKMNVQ